MIKFPTINFEEANKNLVKILAVGVALGIANYALGIWPTLGQSLIQQIAISLVIGYGLILIATNYTNWFTDNTHKTTKYGLLAILFAIVGLLGSEVDGLVRNYAFLEGNYTPLNLKGPHLFNAILSIVLGFGTLNWAMTKNKEESGNIEALTINPKIINEQKENLNIIPIRKGETTLLFPIPDILFFEAYDNYAFLFDFHGKKHLCNYSLLYLEQKLAPNFIRVHRKYLINKNQVAQIKPHFKGRFVIEFKDPQKTTITSSASYTQVIKSLVRL